MLPKPVKLTQKKENYFLAAILLIAAFTRLFHLDYYGFWFDEAISYKTAQLPFLNIIEQVKNDNATPLYFVLQHFWLKMGFESDFLFRFPSVIYGILGVLMTYKLGKLLYDARIGLLSALLLAIASISVHYSQESRPYILQLLLGMITTYYFVKFLREGKCWQLMMWIIFGVLLFYNHIIGVFLIVAHSVYFLTRWKDYHDRRKLFILGNVLIIILSSLWFRTLLTRITQIESEFWIFDVNIIQIAKTFIALTGGNYWDQRNFLAGIMHIPFAITIGAGFVLLIKENRRENLILPIAVILPPLMVFLYSVFRNSLFFYKYFIFISPFLMILAVLGLFSLNNRKLIYGLLVWLLLTCSYYLIDYYQVPYHSEPQRLNTRSAFKLIDNNADSSDVIIHQCVIDLGLETYFVSERYNQGKYREYLWRKEKLPSFFGEQYLNQENKIQSLNKIAGVQRIWVMSVSFRIFNSESLLPEFPAQQMFGYGDELRVSDLWKNLKSAGYKKTRHVMLSFKGIDEIPAVDDSLKIEVLNRIETKARIWRSSGLVHVFEFTLTAMQDSFSIDN